MARRTDLDDNYGSPLGGPLFEAAAKPGLPEFVGDATDAERSVANLIFERKGRANPLSIARLRESTGLSDRAVKGAVEQLVVHHGFPIGASRNSSRGGYFWIVDAEDLAVTVKPSEGQIIAMSRRLRRLNSPARNLELHGQVGIELGVAGEES